MMQVETVWSGALERERILSQQRPAPPVITEPKSRARLNASGDLRDRVSGLLQASRQWWSKREIQQELGISKEQTHTAVRGLLLRGYLMRENEERGRRGTPQRYRWLA
jgi:biotin operon repressor